MQHVAAASHRGQQRVVATLAVAVDPGRALLGQPVGLAMGRVDVDGHRPRSRPGASLPGAGQGLAGDVVELAGRAPGERAQEGAQRGRRGDPVAKHLAGGSGPQPVGTLDPLPTGQGRVDQRHRLVAGVGGARRTTQIDMLVDQLPEHEPLGQGGGQDETGVGDPVVVVEADLDRVGAVG
jgi:hypothetical protein